MKKLIKAVFTLSFFSVLDRTLGFVFKIYLSRKLGAAELGIYQVALSVFFVLITFTSGGIPIVVSKLTAKNMLSGNKDTENSIATAAILSGIGISSVLALSFFILREPIAKIFAAESSTPLILLLLPALIFSSVYSAIRGSLWGREKYVAVSLVEIIEQVTRMVLCFVLFMLGFNKLKVTVLSLTIACAISALSCLIVFFGTKGKLKNPKGYICPIIKSSAPITVSRAASSLINSVIAVVIPLLLIARGMKNEDAMYTYGYSVGMALPLLYIPLTIVGSLAFALVPSLSVSFEKGKKGTLNRQMGRAISFSIIIACLFLPFFAAIGKEIGVFVYNNADSGKFLSYSAWLLVPLAIESITSSMMNSLDLEMKSFLNYCIGSAIMFAVILCFYKYFSIELFSIGLGINWSAASLLHILCIRKKTGISFKFAVTLLQCAAICIPAYFLTEWTYSLTNGIHDFFRIAISGMISVFFLSLLVLVFDMAEINLFKIRKKGSRKNNRLKIIHRA